MRPKLLIFETLMVLAAMTAAWAAPQQIAIVNGQETPSLKAVPYSGVEIEETSQTLADGNRMTRTSKTKIYRDGEGRTRREVTQDDAEPQRIGEITIFDPNTGTTYNLNPKDRTARKQVVEKEVSKSQGPELRPLELARRTPQAVETMKPEVKTESLGEKTIESYKAVGSRTTVTHPAGAMGFEQPIVEVWETWTSPQLHATLLNIRDDPRTGKDVVRLSDISTEDPPASLFELPPDYTVTEETITHSRGNSR